MKGFKIFEQKVGENLEMAIIQAPSYLGNVKPKMDEAVRSYVGDTPSYQFVEIYLDNPWMRVVFKGDIRDLDFKEFNPIRHAKQI